MAQTLGTEWMRNCVAEDGWLLLAKAYVRVVTDSVMNEADIKEIQGVVFSDVRFMNEAEYVRAHGTLIHVWRPDANAVTPHESEKGIPFKDCDRALMNDKTVEVIFRRLNDIMADL
jgi:hypothetical protein